MNFICGYITRQQIEKIDQIREQSVNCNTIKFAMDVAGRVNAADINCIVAIGG